MELWVIGVALSLTATLFGTLGKVFLKLAHSSAQGYSVQLAATLCVFVLNPVFDALSYAYAAQVSLVCMWLAVRACIYLHESLKVLPY